MSLVPDKVGVVATDHLNASPLIVTGHSITWNASKSDPSTVNHSMCGGGCRSSLLTTTGGDLGVRVALCDSERHL